MNKKKTVYCEIEFMKAFMSSFPVYCGANGGLIGLLSSWINFYKFLCKSELALNITKEEYGKLVNETEWAQRLWKKNTDGQCHLIFKGKDFPDVKDFYSKDMSFEEYNCVFLTIQPAEFCKKLAERTGIIVLNNELCMNCNHLYNDNGTSFPNDKAKNWIFMDSLNGVYPKIQTCNSMIIVDPYLLIANNGESFKDKLIYNLEPILKIMLPEQLKDGEPFEIAFFTSDKEVKDYYQQYEYIKDMISRIKPELKFELSVYTGANNFHDRCIITNNTWISCGHGFDVFDKHGNTKKQTSVSIAFPFIQYQLQWCDNSYLNVIAEANVIKQMPHDYVQNCWGNYKKENRILAFYTDKNSTSNGKNSDINEIGKINLTVLGKIDLDQFKTKRKPNRQFKTVL